MFLLLINCWQEFISPLRHCWRNLESHTIISDGQFVSVNWNIIWRNDSPNKELRRHQLTMTCEEWLLSTFLFKKALYSNSSSNSLPKISWTQRLWSIFHLVTQIALEDYNCCMLTPSKANYGSLLQVQVGPTLSEYAYTNQNWPLSEAFLKSHSYLPCVNLPP